MKIEIGPIRPEVEINASPWVGPILPPEALLDDHPCPLCGQPLANGVELTLSAKGLAHANCGAEAWRSRTRRAASALRLGPCGVP